jgi:hypothetical protein
MIKTLIRNEAVKNIADWAESENLIHRFSTNYTYIGSEQDKCSVFS